MSALPKVKLKDCCDIISGSTPRRNRPEFWNGDIPWTTPKDLSNLSQPVLDNTPEHITEAGYKSCSTNLLPKGSILFSSRAPIGLVAIAGREMCTNQGFKSLVPGPEVFSEYLYWTMRHLAPRIQDLGNGATFKEVSKGTMEDVEIPLPPLPEQKRIAAILDKADAIRRKRAQALKLADEFLKSAFLEMFGDPVTNPKGWPIESFAKVCPSRLGKMLDAKQQTGLNPRKYLGNSNVKWFHFDLERLQTMDFSEKDRKEFRLEPGDVLICEGGEVGRSAVWRGEIEEGYFQKALHRVRPELNTMNSEYLVLLMWFMARHGGLRESTSSATIAHLTGEKLKALEVPVPPINAQKSFAMIVERQRDMAFRAQAAKMEAEKIFFSLTQRAFRGEL